jgi:glycosyltransferase involved in cell wall biosynthesis
VRVLLVTGEYPPMRGGVADYTQLLARGLAAKGVVVSVLTSVGATRGHEPDVMVSPSVKNWGVGFWRAVEDQLARVRPDILHVQYQTAAFDMALGVNGWPVLGRLRRRPPTIVTFHDLREPYILPKLGPARHLATMLLAAGASGVVVTNAEDYTRIADRSTSGRTRRAWGRRPLAAIPIGSNIAPLAPDSSRREALREQLGALPDDVLVAFFGFLGQSKGVDVLVEAFDSLVSRGRPVRLMMVGAASGDSGRPDRSYEASIRQALDRPHLRARVAWTGFLDAAGVAAYLQAADLACLPFQHGGSLRHGSLVAALTHELPTVTTTVGPLPPVPGLPRLVSGENALLVPPNDPAAIVSAIEQLAARPELRDTLSAGTRQLAAAFSWETIAEQTIVFYHSVVNRV